MSFTEALDSIMQILYSEAFQPAKAVTKLIPKDWLGIDQRHFGVSKKLTAHN